MNSKQSQEDLISKILNSIFFKNSMGRANRISRNSKSLLNLIQKVLTKSKDLGFGGVYVMISTKVVSIGSLLKAFAVGEYKDVETKNLIIMIASLVYFLSPIDLLPDFLPVLGYADDIVLLTFVLNTVQKEIEKFELWQMNKDIR